MNPPIDLTEALADDLDGIIALLTARIKNPDYTTSVAGDKAKAELLQLITQSKIEAIETLMRDRVQLPWPKDIFGEVPETEWHEIDEFAKTRGYRIDNISATLMRTGWNCYGREVKEYLEDLKEGEAK